MKDKAGMGALALVAQLGFSIAVPMVVFIGGGAWLDGQLGTGPWLLFAGVALGLLAAGAALYQLTKVPASRKVAPRTGATNSESVAGTNRANRRDDLAEEDL